MARPEVRDQKPVVEASADRNLFKRLIWLQKRKRELWSLDPLPTRAREQVGLCRPFVAGWTAQERLTHLALGIAQN